MISIRPHPHAEGAPAAHASGHHPPKHAGILVGLLVAAVTWLWVALVDVALGEPFHTAAVLGGVAAFSTAHLLLCLIFGSALAALMDGAVEEPGLVLSVVFGVLLLEVAFAMLTIFISMTSLGGSAWLRIFVGSLVGTGVAFAMLSRWYPARRLLRDAQAEH